MRALIYEGAGEVAVREVEDARIEETTDVLMRVTSSAICGSDLHMYDGRAGADPGLVLGHEPMGPVQQAGCARGEHPEAGTVWTHNTPGQGPAQSPVGGSLTVPHLGRTDVSSQHRPEADGRLPRPLPGCAASPRWMEAPRARE